MKDYNQTAILSIIRQFALHFQNMTPSLPKLVDQYNEKKKYIVNKIYKQKFKLKCAKMDTSLSG